MFGHIPDLGRYDIMSLRSSFNTAFRTLDTYAMLYIFSFVPLTILLVDHVSYPLNVGILLVYAFGFICFIKLWKYYSNKAQTELRKWI